MQILNSKFNPKTALQKGLPDIPGLDPAKKLFTESRDKMVSTVKDLLKDVKEEVPLPRGVDFGSLGRDLFEDSPLSSFLGDRGIGPASNTRVPKGVNTSGSEIPGGPSLYEKGGMFHKGAPGAPETYAFENTPAGIKFAAENGYESIDLDMLLTKDGVLVGTHYTEPMKKDGFYDPLGKLDEDSKVSEMTFDEVKRLRNEDGQSRIYPMSTMIEHLKKNGIAGDLEAKNDPRFATDEVMGEVADMVRDAGITANLKTIDYGPQAYDVMEMAQQHGFWVRSAKGSGREGRHFGYGETP